VELPPATRAAGTAAGTELPGPHPARGPGPGLDWLHPTRTGRDTRAFADLLAAVEQYLLDHPPISLHHQRARHRILRRGPLSLSDRLLVTVIGHRWKTQLRP
jgi:hypothetical protein